MHHLCKFGEDRASNNLDSGHTTKTLIRVDANTYADAESIA